MESSLKQGSSRGILFFTAGLFFAFLWSSGATATKIGLQAAQPFVICIARVFLAGLVMVLISHGILRNRMPRAQEWKQLAIYGLLNITLYLGFYVLALQEISPGLGSLAVATNPVMISLTGALLFKQPIRTSTWISLLLCTVGVVTAAWPLLQNSYATPMGMLIIFISMLCYSGGVIYFSRKKWSDLDVLTINGWQTLMGGLFLLPVAVLTYRPALNTYNLQFTGSVLWLAIPVSIFAVQLWLFLLRDNPVKASFWLFLCPVFGYLVANLLMKEPIGVFTVTGMALVIGGLYLVQRKKTA